MTTFTGRIRLFAEAARKMAENYRQWCLTDSLGQVTCGWGNRHADHALIEGRCPKCGAAL